MHFIALCGVFKSLHLEQPHQRVFIESKLEERGGEREIGVDVE